MALVRNDGADVVRPARFTAAAGRLLGLDWAAAAHADFPCDMSGVISARIPLAFAEVGIRKPLTLLRGITALRCSSGDHRYSLAETPRRTAALRHPTEFRSALMAAPGPPPSSSIAAVSRAGVAVSRLAKRPHAAWP